LPGAFTLLWVSFHANRLCKPATNTNPKNNTDTNAKERDHGKKP
jgi:hypothetical protein